MAAADIARLADVGRAAVSNWRRRFPDFPEPVGGSAASPLYSLIEVEAWLTRHGRQFQMLPADRVWQRIRGTVDELRLGEFVSYLGAFLVLDRREPRSLRKLLGQPDEQLAAALTERILAAVPELPRGLPERPDAEWIGMIRMTAEAAEDQGHTAVFDFLCERYLEVQSRRVPITPGPVVELMVDLADVEQGTVFNPACGAGTILLAAQARGATGLLGQEINSAIAGVAAARLLLHDGSVHIVAGDSLRHDAFAELRADAAVCNPPFNERSWGYDELASDPRWEYGLPPRGEPELAWVQHCLAHVVPGGRVVIMMPAGAASRRAGRRIRGNLLRAGALRAVICLPSTGLTAIAAPDLWVLRRPTADQLAPSHVLIADASDDPSAIQAAWRSFLDDPQRPPSAGGRAVRIIDMLDDEVDISPARWLNRAGDPVDTGRFALSRAQLLSATAALSAALPELDAPEEAEPLTMTNIGELVKAGVLTIHQAPLKATTDGGDSPALTVNDVRLGRPASGSATGGPGSVSLQPGDVVTPMASRHPVARVVADGGALLGPQLLLFRPDPQHIDPHFLAGFLRAGQEAGPTRGSSLVQRTEFRRIAIPRLPLSEQRRYGEAFVRLTMLEDRLREVASLGESLVRQGFAGLAGDGLKPPDIEEKAWT